MNKLLIISLLLITKFLFSQTKVASVVIDAETGDVISNCNVVCKTSKQGTITNKDGYFELLVDDSIFEIEISHIKYEPIVLSTSSIQNQIFLTPVYYILSEVVVGISDKEIYNAIKEIRKTLNKHNDLSCSKLYYLVETNSNKKPVEVLECYYNAYLSGIEVYETKFKNGKSALDANSDNNYFLSLHSSRAFVYYSFFNKTSYMPYNPLQLKFKENLKYYDFIQVNINNNLSKIIFTANEKFSDIAFNGEFYYNPKNYELKNIELNGELLANYPFLPILYVDSISNININYTANIIDNKLNYIEFDYSFNYHSNRDSTVSLINEKVLNYNVSTNGFLYFYDYFNNFIEPYFEFDNNYWDYYKMAIIPYNDFFWDNCYYIPLSNKKKENLNYIKENSSLTNYYNWGIGKNTLGSKISNEGQEESYFFSDNYIFWKYGKEIQITQFKDTTEVDKYTLAQSYKSDLYNLEVQLLLDVNKFNEEIDVKSYTVFDISKTYFNLPKDSITNDFVTTYFSICEIERRLMQKKIDNNDFDILQVDSIYNSTIESMTKITQSYLADVDVGLNLNEMNKWKQYVTDHLGFAP